MGLPLLLGAPQLGHLQRAQAPISATNASELSSAYTIVVILVLAGVAAYLRGAAPGRLRLPRHALALGMPVAVLLLWCTVKFPQEALHLPLLSRIPPERVAEAIGIPLTIMAGLTLAGLARRHDDMPTRRLGVAVASPPSPSLRPRRAPCRRSNLLGLPIWSIWLVSGAWAAGLGLVVLIPDRSAALVPLAVLVLGTTLFMNPTQQGAADLRTSAAARAIEDLSQRLAPGDRRAGSDPWTAAVLMANAIPLINGYQGAPSRPFKAVQPGLQLAAWSDPANDALVSDVATHQDDGGASTWTRSAT